MTGIRRAAWRAIALLLALLLVGGSVPRSIPSRAHIIKAAVALPDFNFLAWELDAVGSKVFTGRLPSQVRLDSESQVKFVRAYLERRQRIRQVEGELRHLVANEPLTATEDHGIVQRGLASAQEKDRSNRSAVPSTVSERPLSTEEARLELAALRLRQVADRPLVESVLQHQIREEVLEAGLGLRGFVWPPVQFAFIEPPFKLTVSLRDRITTLHSRVLSAEYDPVTLAESERAIQERTNLSAHISQIGGMAVYPAMVVESSSLEWVLSTIAHEWVHHYLFLFPLGLRYASNDEVTTLNETIAEIVGNEIGERLVRRYDSEAALSPAGTDGSPTDENCACNTADLWSQSRELAQQRWERYDRPLPFDFQRAMRETRLHVDALLGAGLVETAEAYMEARRRYFVAQGYPLRVLNQAYFAFHGSYATGAAASSPIGPLLQQLRSESDDLAHFLEQVRWFTSLSDLEKALGAN